MNAARIIVFAKAPQPGLAKTRLTPTLGARGAAELARRMLLHTLGEALAAGLGAVELCASPNVADAAWREVALPAGIEFSAQGDGDLGARMARAAQRAIGHGQAALLVGTDCVEMSSEILRAAARGLREHDAVLHGAADGGYALLGLKRYSPLLFDDIPWSTGAVARMTLERLGQLGWSTHIGQTLHDVDEPEDLKFLAACRA